MRLANQEGSRPESLGDLVKEVFPYTAEGLQLVLDQHHSVVFMETGHFRIVPAFFQLSISLFMGLPGLILPFAIIYFFKHS